MKETWDEYMERLYASEVANARGLADSKLLRGFGENTDRGTCRYILARRLMWEYGLWWEDAWRVASDATLLHWYKKLVGEV